MTIIKHRLNAPCAYVNAENPYLNLSLCKYATVEKFESTFATCDEVSDRL